MTERNALFVIFTFFKEDANRTLSYILKYRTNFELRKKVDCLEGLTKINMTSNKVPEKYVYCKKDKGRKRHVFQKVKNRKRSLAGHTLIARASLLYEFKYESEIRHNNIFDIKLNEVLKHRSVSLEQRKEC